MTTDYSDSIESVALRLFERISEAEEKEGHRGKNVPVRQDLLELYVKCLVAVRADTESLSGHGILH